MDPVSTEPPHEEAKETVAVRPWSSLLFRDYRLLWIGNLFAGVAGQMKQIANLYQVYDLTGSPLQLGLTGLFQFAPAVLFGLLGGSLADVFDRKKLILITQGFSLVPPILLGALTVSGDVQVWHIYVLATLTSAVGTLGGPARMAFIPRLVPRSHLLNAATLNISSGQWTSLLGPMLAGILIDLTGVEGAYFVTALLLVPPFFAIASIRTSGKPEGARARVSVRSLWEGVHFIWVQRIILALFLLDFGATLVGYYRPLLPIFAKDIYKVGATGLGMLYSAPAIGAVVGTLAFLFAGDVKKIGPIAVLVTISFGVGLAFLGMSQWLWMGIIAIGLLGLTDAISVTIRRTTVQMLSPDHMMGRATSLVGVFASSTNGLGALMAGLAAALLGAPNALILGGILCVLFVIGITLAIPQLWRYRSS